MTSDQDNGRAAVGRDTLESTMWDATAEPEPKTDILQGRVEADVAAIKKAGARIGTPSFFINGKLLQGAQPFPSFKSKIEAALAETK